MDTELVVRHWAPLLALFITAIVVLRLLPPMWRQTSRGRLATQVGRLRSAERASRRAARDVRRRANRLLALEQKAQRVRPRDLERARGRLSDAESLAKICADKAMVEANRLRKVIYEDFPPDRHDALRARFLPRDLAEGRPIRF